jgi:prephenate dehydrogenase
VAGGEANLWRPIFAANRQHVLAALDQFSQVFDHLRETLEQGDDESLTAILEMAAKTKRERDALGD